ncbi:hypothetical protein A2U01_0073943, partial [Trifolium medium]|nr:hypothetical protein [Trifolium medium]
EMRLERFMKQKPPTFTGGYNLNGAYKWLEELAIIFEAMECPRKARQPLEPMYYARRLTSGGRMLR